MDLDDAVKLLDAYLDAEWAATEAVYSEPDDTVVDARVREANAFTRSPAGAPLGVTVSRAPGADVAAMRPQLSQFARRRLFQVIEHAHPLWGRLYGGTAGSSAASAAGNYERLYFVADTEDGPRIVSEYVPELFTPEVEWSHFGGVVIEDPGPVVAVRSLQPPDRERDRANWEAAQ